MSQSIPNSVPAPAPGRAALLGLAAVVLGTAFFCTEHNLFVSQMEVYATTLEDLEANAAGGKLKNQVGFSLVALLGVFLLLRRGGRPWSGRGLLPLLVLFFVGWCLTSALWTVDPGRTVRRLGVMTFCFLGALGIGRQLSTRDLCLLALIVTTTFAAVGVCVELALGTLTPFATEYRFAGTLHPNGQGANLATLCLAAVCLLRGGDRRRRPLLPLLTCAAGLLVLTGSRTCCAALLAGLLALYCVRPWARRALALLGLAWSASVAALLAVLVGSNVVERSADVLLLGRAEHAGTLTGRTELWEELLPYVQDRPVLGHGYGSFWNEGNVEALSTTLYWGLSSAHSAYLDAVLSVGLVGAAAAASVAAVGMARAARAYRASCAAGPGMLLGLLVFGAVSGVAESDFFMPSFEAFLAGCGLCRLAFFQGDEGQPPERGP
jgi:O-antigen ligase